MPSAGGSVVSGTCFLAQLGLPRAPSCDLLFVLPGKLGRGSSCSTAAFPFFPSPGKRTGGGRGKRRMLFRIWQTWDFWGICWVWGLLKHSVRLARSPHYCCASVSSVPVKEKFRYEVWDTRQLFLRSWICIARSMLLFFLLCRGFLLLLIDH